MIVSSNNLLTLNECIISTLIIRDTDNSININIIVLIVSISHFTLFNFTPSSISISIDNSMLGRSIYLVYFSHSSASYRRCFSPSVIIGDNDNTRFFLLSRDDGGNENCSG